MSFIVSEYDMPVTNSTRLRSSLEPLKLTRSFLPLRVSLSALRKLIVVLCVNAADTATNSQPKGQPKAQPKSAAADKHNAGAAKGATKGAAGNKKRRGRSSRPAKKTQEELDSEMADYFVAPAATEATSNPAAPIAAPAAAGGDADMDEIAVCTLICISEINANHDDSKLGKA
jgi:THO complex subunit 4